MSIPENKHRITITLSKEVLVALKNSAEKNFRKPSYEVEYLIVNHIINKEA